MQIPAKSNPLNSRRGRAPTDAADIGSWRLGGGGVSKGCIFIVLVGSPSRIRVGSLSAIRAVNGSDSVQVTKGSKKVNNLGESTHTSI